MGDITELPATRDYAYRVRIEYKTGQAFEVEALTVEELLDAINIAVKTVWPNQDKPMSLVDMHDWLGWS